jgi:O-antigen ligase
MDVQLRAYVVVLALSVTIYHLLRKPLSDLVDADELRIWRNHWLVVTTILFLGQNFWIFITLVCVYLLFSLPRDPNQRLPLYFAILCAAPQITAVVPGIGGIESFFQINYARALSLLFFLPLWVRLVQRPNPRGRLFSLPQDKYILGLCLIFVVFQGRDVSLTIFMRTAFHVFLDVVLPYYVISRYLRDEDTVQKILAAIVVSTTIMAAIALFEYTKSWLLYEIDLGVLQRGAGFRVRAGWLRAQATFGQPIVLGYVLMIGFGALLGISGRLASLRYFVVIAALLAAAQIAPLSRGPWVGFGVLLVIWVGTGAKKLKSAFIASLGSLVALSLLQFTQFGEKLFRLLPFVGDIEEETADFRVALFESAMEVASRNLWFGTRDFLDAPELRVFEVRWGIVDITNSYLEYLLQYGVVGLSFFVLLFLTVSFPLFRSTLKRRQIDQGILDVSRALLAIIGSIMLVIATVSSITFVPVYYWAIAAVSVAYVQILREKGGTD